MCFNSAYVCRKIKQIWNQLFCPIFVHMHVSIQCNAPVENLHYNDAIMGAIASQITSLTVVYSTVYSDADQRKHQSSVSLTFVREFTGDPHKWPVTRKMFLFDDVLMRYIKESIPSKFHKWMLSNINNCKIDNSMNRNKCGILGILVWMYSCILFNVKSTWLY